MLKALLKKQLLELTNGFVIDKKTGKRRTGGGLAGVLVLYLFVFLSLFAVFFMMGTGLCVPLCKSGMSWLYFAIMGLVSMALGLFGSVFNTYASLYQAKDNDLLLAMPIPPGNIILVRLMGVYMMGLMYSSFAMIPAIVVYYINAARSVTEFVFPVLLLLFISVLVLTFSCLLGWVVAQISARIKNRSFITVALSLVFVAGYYYVYYRATAFINSIVENREAIGRSIRGSVYSLYLMGCAGAGETVPMLLFAAGAAALFALMYLVLARTFFSTVTTNRGVSKRKTAPAAYRARGMDAALFSRELGRFTASPAYMLNSALGTVLLTIGAALAVIKGGAMLGMLSAVVDRPGRYAAVLAFAAVCLLSAMNYISTPSISLEGRTLWLIRSLPVPAWRALRAKLMLHMAVTGIPAAVCGVCASIGLHLTAVSGILLTATALLFVLDCAAFGLLLNLRSPLLDWKDETVPIKQSMNGMVSMLCGVLTAGAFGGIYFAVAGFIGEEIYLLLCAALLTAPTALLLRWIKTRGVKIFETL